MNNDISTIFNRSYKVRCCKCVINNKWNVMCMCNLSNSFNINNFRIRISKCFNLNSFSIRLDCCFNSIIIKRIYECSFNSVIWKCMCKKVICSTVDILSCYDMISCMSKRLESISQSCCTRTNSKCCYTTFKCCDSLFEYIFCWIGKTTVDVTCILKTKSVSSMLAVMEYI